MWEDVRCTVLLRCRQGSNGIEKLLNKEGEHKAEEMSNSLFS